MKTLEEIQSKAKGLYPLDLIKHSDNQIGYIQGYQDGQTQGLKWLKVDPNNLPSGEVLARNKHLDSKVGILETYDCEMVHCNSNDGSGFMRDVVDYLFIDDLNKIPKQL
jgi:hypothetical protein